MYKFNFYVFLFSYIYHCVHFSVIRALNTDSRFSPLEKEALKQYKLAVSDILYDDYHQLDSYLIHFLRHKHLNISAATDLLKENFKWRKAEKIDSILQEKRMIELEKQLPISTDGIDRDGRPILSTIVGKIDIRKFVLTGKTQEYFRYNIYATEKILRKVYYQALAGKDVSQYVALADLNGFNVRQHVCLPCIPESTAFVRLLLDRYPNTVRQIVYVNAPRTFATFFSLARDVLTPELLKKIHVFGFDNAEWRSHLARSIDDDQLAPSFGGTRI